MVKLNVKVGETVEIRGTYRDECLGIVERVTPSGRFFVDGNEYNADGDRRGGSWRSPSAYTVTPERLEALKDRTERRQNAKAISLFGRMVESDPVRHPVKSETLKQIAALIAADTTPPPHRVSGEEK